MKAIFLPISTIICTIILLATSVNAGDLPKSIRCEAKAPFRRYNDGEIRGKVLGRMYDLNFDSSTFTFDGEYQILVQTHCCLIPVTEKTNFPKHGEFSTNEEGTLLEYKSEQAEFAIDLSRNTCFFSHEGQRANVTVKGKLVAKDGTSVD